MRWLLGIIIACVIVTGTQAITPQQLFALSSPTNLVVNGNFALTPLNASQNTIQNGWQWRTTPGTGTASLVWGLNSVVITGDGTNTAQLSQPMATVAGVTYTLGFDISVNAMSVVAVGTSAYSTNLFSSIGPVGIGQRIQFVATGTISWITFSKGSAVSSTVANVLVKRR